MSPEHARRLASVDPRLGAAFMEISADFAEAFPGWRITPAQGFRTPAQQKHASASGRSKADGTSVFSKHQAYPALALDFAVLDPGGTYITDGEDPHYAWVGKRFESAGFGWGGSWPTPDWDHVEIKGPRPAAVAEDFAIYKAVAGVATHLTLMV